MDKLWFLYIYFSFRIAAINLIIWSQRYVFLLHDIKNKKNIFYTSNIQVANYFIF